MNTKSNRIPDCRYYNEITLVEIGDEFIHHLDVVCMFEFRSEYQCVASNQIDRMSIIIITKQ